MKRVFLLTFWKIPSPWPDILTTVFLHFVQVLKGPFVRDHIFSATCQINQMSLPYVRFAVKITSGTPASITGLYQDTTQADRDVEYREWFKTVQSIFREIHKNG